jgi:hypothetical protein
MSSNSPTSTFSAPSAPPDQPSVDSTGVTLQRIDAGPDGLALRVIERVTTSPQVPARPR